LDPRAPDNIGRQPPHSFSLLKNSRPNKGDWSRIGAGQAEERPSTIAAIHLYFLKVDNADYPIKGILHGAAQYRVKEVRKASATHKFIV
jgi:hypothetical protein